MNKRLWRCWPGPMAALLWIAGVSGCQHFDPPFMQEAAVATTGRGPMKLTGQQVADVQVAVGRSFEKRGETAQAIAAYSEAVRQDPGRADACLRLAILRDQEGKFKESLELYRKALAGQPGSPDIFCDMGYSLYLQRRWAEAEINLRQAIALAPGHQRAHNNLGLVLAHADRWEEALAEFRWAGCGEADAQINLAFALTLENNWPEAHKHYEMALAADAASVAATRGLRELDSLIANADELRRVTTWRDPLGPAAEIAVPSGSPAPSKKEESNQAASRGTSELPTNEGDSWTRGQRD